MKNKILFLTSLLLMAGYIGCTGEKTNDSVDEEKTTTVFSSPDLNVITTKWVDIYSDKYPDAKIRIVEVPESSLSSYIDLNRSVGFISEKYSKGITNELTWKETIAREVLVPVISQKNPLLREIEERGVSLEELAMYISNPSINDWGVIIGAEKELPMKLYIVDNPSASEGLSNLFEETEIGYSGVSRVDKSEILSLIKSDPGSLGFCFLNDIIEADNSKIAEGIRLLPIDRNGNGTIDYMESFYGNMQEFGRAVWIGKYPALLSNNIYSVSSMMPESETEKSFLKWVLTDGQELLNNHGYSDLLAYERLAKVNMLKEPDSIETVSSTYSMAKQPLSFYIYFPIILTFGIILFLLVYHSIEYLRARNVVIPGMISSSDRVLDSNLIESPQGLYYDKSHTWAYMEKDGSVKIGIDDFLQHLTGPITSVKMKKPGEKIRKGGHIISIAQQGKQLDIYAAVSGTIKEQNEKLLKNTSVINSSPYVDGWIYKIEPSNWIKEIQFMLFGSGYRDWLKNEFTRFKEFLMTAMKSSNVEYARILQDGGEIKDGILKDFGPKVWEDFQSNFIDISA